MILSQINSNDYIEPVIITPISIDGGTTFTGYEIQGSYSQWANYSVTSGYFDYSLNFGIKDHIAYNLTPEIFNLSDNYAERISQGLGKILINYGLYKKTITLDFLIKTDYSYQRFDSYTVGSYANWALNQIDTLIGEKTGIPSDLFYYNGSSYGAAIAQPGGIARNPSCWAADLDFSGVCVYSHLSHWYGGGYFGGGAVITPRHYIVSHHFEPGNRVGRPLRFVGSDGVVYERTIIAQTTGSEINAITNPIYSAVGDTCLFLLDSDLPENVKIYPIVGDWLINSFQTGTIGNLDVYTTEFESPFITIDQQRKVKILICSTIRTNTTALDSSSLVGEIYVQDSPYPAVFGNVYGYENYINFQSSPYGGDSGSPVFVLLPNNELALYTVIRSSAIGQNLNEPLLNAMIIEVDTRAGISTGYTVTVASEPII